MTREQLNKLNSTLGRYKSAKQKLEKRVIQAENWWKLRNSFEEKRSLFTPADAGFHSTTGWLHNVIVNKHADAIDSFPAPVILPREPGDKKEAEILSEIIPCVLEQNRFEEVYSNVCWQKLKTGTGVYKVIWDQSKLNGLGDISITRVDLLNLFWEPGITDIQRSKYVFHTQLEDREKLEKMYPEYKGKFTGHSAQGTVRPSKFRTDDPVTDTDKVCVVECYWKEKINGRQILSYVKYCGDQVLYETNGESLYDHGLYPFVFDVLFPVEGSPCGYGYIDLCSNSQTSIDLLSTAFVRNAMVGSMPRYFSRIDGAVNEDEFLDVTKPIIHVNGNLGEDSLKSVSFSGLPTNALQVLDRMIDELRQTSGNTETATGKVSSGVTAASAIVALQEASGKGSRDSIRGTYRAFQDIVSMCIELQRQFYDLPRKYRILGSSRAGMQFTVFSNEGLKPQPVFNEYGVDLGLRLPVFDIKVEAQKKDAYSRLSQNELAIQFYRLGFFVPENAAPALMCMEMMDFENKDRIMAAVADNAEAAARSAQGTGLS